jgi:hypothetical protein
LAPYFEPEESKLKGLQGCLNLRQRKAVFLDMEQKIAAIAQAEEVLTVADFCHLGIVVRSQSDDVLSTSANVLRGCRIALLGNQGSSKNDMLACGLTIEADFHDPPRAQKIDQDMPTSQWVAKVVKDANALDEIELTPDGP